MFQRRRVSHNTEMSFLEHLDELRYRLIVCLAAICLTTICVGMPLANFFVEFLIRPLRTANVREKDKPLTIAISPDGAMRVKDTVTSGALGKLSNFRINFEILGSDGKVARLLRFGPHPEQSLYFMGPFDPIFIYMKAAALLGVAVAIPIWLWQLWAFVAPAFTPTEARWIRPVFLAALVLFPIGVTFAYVFLRFAFEMLLNSFTIAGLEPRLDVTRYMSFVLMFMLVFGAVFETPLVVVLLVRMGIVSTKTLRATRGYAILIIAIVAAIVTPPDPVSMLVMMAPLVVLYEASIWISIALEKRLQAESAKEETT